MDIQISAKSTGNQICALERIYMLSTIVMVLLAIWLSIMIIGQIAGGYIGYNFIKELQKLEEKAK